MNDRLLDHVLLVGVRLKDSTFHLLNEPQGGQIPAGVQLTVGQEYKIITGVTTEGLPDAYSVLVTLRLDIKDNQRELPIVLSTVSVEGLFARLGDHSELEAQFKENPSDLARLVFPVARAEIARLLAQARLADVPIQWDLPRAVNPEPQEVTKE